jgi:hypothetical protein
MALQGYLSTTIAALTGSSFNETRFRETSAEFYYRAPRALIIQMDSERGAIAAQSLLFGVIGSVVFVVACFVVLSRRRAVTRRRRHYY